MGRCCEKDNLLLSFYKKYNISPVHQNIRDFKLHLKRRQKLYRLLGLAPAAFFRKKILEIGPGGGYNALAFFKWRSEVDFIEPNPTAQEELKALLEEYKISKTRWRLFPCKLEGFRRKERYEIVIAEGIIPSGLVNCKEVISKLSRLVAPGGVVVVNCTDEIGLFFEIIKRIVGHYLIKKNKVDDFQDKIEVFTKAFSSHLKRLKFASRPVCDWVLDNFLSPAIYGKYFNLLDCMNEFGDEFSLLGSSPHMFSDWSWYKDIEFNQRRLIIEQYNLKKHVLILADLGESLRPGERNNKLAKKLYEFRMFCRIAEFNLNREKVRKITSMLKEIANLTSDIDKRIAQIITEAIQFLSDDDLSIAKISSSRKLASAFGKGLQYLSLVKRI